MADKAPITPPEVSEPFSVLLDTLDYPLDLLETAIKAEQAWDQVTDDLIALRTLAVSCPNAPLAQMAFCLGDALGCDSRGDFDQHIRLGVQILQRAFVGPASREVVQALRTAVSHLETIAKLDRFAPDEIDPPGAASSPPSI